MGQLIGDQIVETSHLEKVQPISEENQCGNIRKFKGMDLMCDLRQGHEGKHSCAVKIEWE